MGNKKSIIWMGLVFVLCLGYWQYLVHFVYPKHPEWDLSGTASTAVSSPDATTQPATMPAGSIASASTSTSTSTSPSISAAPGGLKIASTRPTSGAVVIGSKTGNDPDYSLALNIVPEGAGLDAVTINSYKDSDAKALYVFQQPYADYPEQRALSTRKLTIAGQEINLTDSAWYLEKSTRAAATYGIDIQGADHLPLLHISKTYGLSERGPKSGRTNTAAGYEVAVSFHLQNLSPKSLNDVRLQLVGPTMPPREMERSDDRQIVAGYDKGGNTIDVIRKYLAEFKPTAADQDLSTDKTYKFLWAGMSSVYFAAIVQPEKEGQVDEVWAHCLNSSADAENRVAELDIQTAGISLLPGAAADLPFKVFIGPKERDLLEGDYFAEFPRLYNQLLTGTGSSCAVCALPWLVDSLIFLLGCFHFILRDWGLSIIALVLLVRLILHPISKSSQVSMLRLQKMGPELERLKKKHADDKEAFAKAQMEMHKEMGIAPFLGCLPMFLQMPIWIALYTALQNDIVLRQAPFLWGWTWIHDLSRPDRMISWDLHPFIVPLINMKVTSLNVLPLVVAVVMFLQQKLQPQAPTITPEQQSQQKMMRYMSLAFSLFFYWMPSGLNLYILTSSTIAIFESKRIRDHIKQREELEKSNKVIIESKPTRQGKQLQKLTPIGQDTKAGCLGGAWANLQQRAETIRTEADRKTKKGN